MPVLTYVYEDAGTSRYTDHDQLFKELLHTFFAEFLELFFPEVHKYIDFSAIRPLSEEVFTDLLGGESRRADIVIEATLKGEETILIIHVEPQSYYQANFHERMYLYFSLLYNKYRKPILPIAVFTYDKNYNEKNEFSMSFPFFHVLSFQFLTLTLRKLRWRDFIHSNNPVAAALLCKMGFTEAKRVEVKKEFLRMLVRMQLDPARQRLIYGFFERYLKLTDEEEKVLMQEVNKLDPELSSKIMELPISYEERGKEIGKEIGRNEEKREIAKKMILEGLSPNLIAKVTGLSHEEIKVLSDSINN
ncbi:Rpn family recombination-promoting nuclease/putative transposase [Caldifermentibacillus hisashii]|uniref:Rpn family recombination-promoting nuclease/putative transposase n=1 Tax=Caldifermentibacillus hisashii TaxID=996558 RepID=UPI001C1210F3|nr:Rpn family recombination-promoting nuclease/putative transposase [Caldifermentibacillus hisashii]MBU5343246.1 Rpn family recombination-promoting nuclease/putative transposase [Caldifermentibacillus hisashii]